MRFTVNTINLAVKMLQLSYTIFPDIACSVLLIKGNEQLGKL